MDIFVNQNLQQVPDSTTLSVVLAQFGIHADTKGVALAINQCVIARKDWHLQSLHHGDHITIIRATQGG